MNPHKWQLRPTISLIRQQGYMNDAIFRRIFRNQYKKAHNLARNIISSRSLSISCMNYCDVSCPFNHVFSSDMYSNVICCSQEMSLEGAFPWKNIANDNLFLPILLENIIMIWKRQLIGSENRYLGLLVVEVSNGGGGSHVLGGSETRTPKFPCSLFKGCLEGRYFKN